MGKQKVVKLIKKIYPSFGLKDNDIILASYPKSGNTWVRFIWYNIVSLRELGGEDINFHDLGGKLCANYDTHTYGKATYDTLPRLVKTHSAHKPVFDSYKTIFLYRDPRDVMVSYYKYLSGKKGNEKKYKNISQFVRSKKYGIRSWCEHFDSWRTKYDISITYEALKESEVKVLEEVFSKFSLENINTNTLKKAIKKSRFENLKKIEEESSRPRVENEEFDKDHKFMRKGEIGNWQEVLRKRDLDFIHNMMNKFQIKEY